MNSAHRRAFTLLELLTVLGIIAVLSSLLLPVLGRAKRSARQATCIGNLRQLGIAGQMYWDDNNGQAFRWRGSATNNGQIYWFGWLADGQEGQRQFDRSRGALHPYLGGMGVEVCPSLAYGNSSFKLKATGAAYGYGYNLALSQPAGEPALNVATIRRPCDLVFLADAAQVNTFQPPASPQHPMLEEFYYVHTNDLTAHFRHSSAAETIFCDGHAGAEPPVPGSLDPRLPRERVGLLRRGVLANE